eukprot:c26859_g1_i1.p2 GENE.c26859_g1_i1~~c26859_g1_i1.p2  ORF type:complete len:273 (-),score=26.82 c26859_g1_i1:471-1193(-)
MSQHQVQTIRRYLDQRQAIDAERMYAQLVQDGYTLEPEIFEKMVTMLAKRKEFDRAFEVLTLACQTWPPPTVLNSRLFGPLMVSLVATKPKERNWHGDVMAMLVEARARGAANAFVYYWAMASCHNSGNRAVGLELHAAMLGEGVVPSDKVRELHGQLMAMQEGDVVPRMPPRSHDRTAVRDRIQSHDRAADHHQDRHQDRGNASRSPPGRSRRPRSPVDDLRRRLRSRSRSRERTPVDH